MISVVLSASVAGMVPIGIASVLAIVAQLLRRFRR